MGDFAKLVRAAAPATGIQFRAKPYGNDDVRRFLRDVIAMANADVEGPRYIVIGVAFDRKGGRRLKAVTRDDFSGKPSYQGLVADFVEPPIRLKYKPVEVDGKRLGVFKIGDCQDRPYMMRVDHSEKLRRGDAYIRVDNTPIKMGRRQLLEMFGKKFRDAVSADRVEIGFAGEIIHKDKKIQTIDLGLMPSAIASKKLEQLLDFQSTTRDSGSTAVMARLTHARLYGADSPYEDRSVEDLMAEMAQIKKKHRLDDEYFLFETNAQEIQLIVYNQGDEPIRDASLSIVLPNHNAFYVASRLPKVLRNGKYVERPSTEGADYPAVTLKDDAIHVSNTLGEIPTGAPVNAFETPLRICVGSDLKGRKLGIRYSLFGGNLRKPASGKLRLLL
ncbi:MAG: ATP-binding protein [Woeseia sp.]